MTQVSKKLPVTPKSASRTLGPIAKLLDPELFKALGDPTRVRLLACLARCSRPCTVGEVAECCSVDLSVVSRHLALLARAGLLTPVREGRLVRYEVRYAHVATVLRRLASEFESCAPCGPCADGGCCVETRR